MKIAVAFSVFVIVACVIWIARRDPYAVERRALELSAGLKPGMTEPDVWRHLEVEHLHLRARTSGSGPATNWPSFYPFTPELALQTRWDVTKNPPILNGANVVPNTLGHTLKQGWGF